MLEHFDEKVLIKKRESKKLLKLLKLLLGKGRKKIDITEVEVDNFYFMYFLLYI
jgi:hypothetical protein